MRTALAVLVLLLASRDAHAMGMDVSYGLVAWNDDHSSALLLREAADAEGDADVHYIVISAAAEEVDVEISTSVTDEPQGTDRASCEQALRELKGALADRHFHGVRVTPRVCKRTKRAGAVTANARARRAVERSWIDVAPAEGECQDQVSYANGGGVLILQFRTPACGGPTQVQLTTLVLDGATAFPA